MFTAAYLANRTPHSALNMGTPYKALHGKDATLQHLRTIGSRAFIHIEMHTKKLEDKSWEGRLCGYSQETKTYRIYNAKTNKVVESRNVVFIETPSKLVSLPTTSRTTSTRSTTSASSVFTMYKRVTTCCETYETTYRVSTSATTYDHTIRIVQPRDPAIAEILTKIRGLTQADVLAGKETPRAPADGVDGLQSPTDDGGGQQPAAGGGVGSKGDPLGGTASNSGGAPPQHQVTPAVTRGRSRAASALLSTAALRKLQQLCLHTNTAWLTIWKC